MISHIHRDLDRMTAIVDDTLVHCTALQVDDAVTSNQDVEREVHHLHARVAAVAAQLADAQRTLRQLEMQAKRGSPTRPREASAL